MELSKLFKDKKQFTLLSGAILGALQVLWLLILLPFDKIIGSSLTSMQWVISGVFLYLILKFYRDHFNDGVIKYGQSVGQGVKIAALSGIIIGAFYFILIKFIDPAFIDKMIIEVEEAYLNMGIPDSTVEDLSEQLATVYSAWTMFFGTALSAVFNGLIVSLIVSFFIKKSSSDPFQDAMKDISDN